MKKNNSSFTEMTSSYDLDSCHHNWFVSVSIQFLLFDADMSDVSRNISRGIVGGSLKNHRCEKVIIPFFPTCPHTCFVKLIRSHLLERSCSEKSLKYLISSCGYLSSTVFGHGGFQCSTQSFWLCGEHTICVSDSFFFRICGLHKTGLFI